MQSLEQEIMHICNQTASSCATSDPAGVRDVRKGTEKHIASVEARNSCKNARALLYARFYVIE
jgi:hypothetical protein